MDLHQHTPEHSIYNAHLHFIENAEHYVYIENHFFIFSQNQIQSALAERILKAYKNDLTFHAMIVMPLKPKVSGKYGEQSGAQSEETYWEELSLNTLYEALEDGGIPEEEIHDYISVYGL